MSKPDPIASSGLPSEVQDLVRQVVRRTRLWKRERHALTVELLAHFGDGLDAGRSAEDLIKTFGDPKLAATLMRRAKKRNRPLWWRIARRTLQSVGVLILLYLGQMAILLTGRPEPKVDYIARLCEKADAVSQADRAWPIYREAWLKDPPGKIEWRPRVVSGLAAAESDKWAQRQLSESRPGEPYWDQAVALVQQHAILLDVARAGVAKPGLGITLRERRDYRSDYRRMFPFAPSSHGILAIADNTLDGSENSAIFSMVRLLQIDIQWAASQGDSARVVQDYRAIAGLCRQMSETRTFIVDLLRLIATMRADAALTDALVGQPDLLSAEQCVELLHTMQSVREAVTVTFESERLYWDDMVQRIYTDDGNGDGRLTQLGAECFIMQGSGKRPHVTSALSLPLLSACIASRRDMTQAGRERYDMMERNLQRPLRELLDTSTGGSELDKSVLKMRQSILSGIHYWPLSVTIPQFTGVGKDVYIARAVHDALTVALALEAYRRDAGAYPEILNQLVPRYLPAIPADPLANQPLLYTLYEGKPVIYAPGRDGIDRGGKPAGIPPATVPESSDWILFPPASP